MNTELIGLTAASLTSSAFIPQVYQTWKTKSTESLSLLMLVTFQTGTLLWFFYGYYIDSVSILCSSSITALLQFLLLFLKIKFNLKK